MTIDKCEVFKGFQGFQVFSFVSDRSRILKKKGFHRSQGFCGLNVLHNFRMGVFKIFFAFGNLGYFGYFR